MMALTQENVHYTLNSGPSRTGFMRGSRNFCQGGGGGGEGGGSRPDGQKIVWTMFFQSSTFFTVYRVDQMVLLQRGGGGPTSSRGGGGGVSKETHITFQGGGDPDPNPLWNRTWGRLTLLFAYRIMVYQNLDKTEKYHPTTTKRKKATSCWSR